MKKLYFITLFIFLSSCSLFPKFESVEADKWYHQRDFSWKSPLDIENLSQRDYYTGVTLSFGDGYKDGYSGISFTGPEDSKYLMSFFKCVFELIASQEMLTRESYSELALPCDNDLGIDNGITSKDILSGIFFHSRIRTVNNYVDAVSLERKQLNNLDCIFIKENYSYFCRLNEDSFVRSYSSNLDEGLNKLLEEILRSIKIRDTFILPRLRAV